MLDPKDARGTQILRYSDATILKRYILTIDFAAGAQRQIRCDNCDIDNDRRLAGL